MNTFISYEKDGKKYNSFNQEVITCKKCKRRKTVMTGTRLCDFCWEENRKKWRK